MSVLVCYDGSPSAKHALMDAAEAISQSALARTNVSLLHVWSKPSGFPAGSFSYQREPATQSADGLIQRAEEAAKQTLEEGRLIATTCGLTPQTLLACKDSSIAATILRIADEQDSSMIVIGARWPATPAPPNSTGAAILADSPRPVLVVPLKTSATESTDTIRPTWYPTQRSALSRA
jgi:nucleotide-binding universal stress UspA family protein